MFGAIIPISLEANRRKAKGGDAMTTVTADSQTVPPGEPRPIVPPLAAFYSHARDLSYLIVRLTAGGMLLVHGIFKVMPMAEKGFAAVIAAFAAGSMARRGIEPAHGRRLRGVLPRDDRRDLHHARPVHALLRGGDRDPVRGHHVRRALAGRASPGARADGSTRCSGA